MIFGFIRALFGKKPDPGIPPEEEYVFEEKLSRFNSASSIGVEQARRQICEENGIDPEDLKYL